MTTYNRSCSRVAGMLALAATIVGCSSSDKADAPTDSSLATTVAVSSTLAPPTTEPASTTAAPTTIVADTLTPTTTPATFSAGLVIVGTDVPPGIYESNVPIDDSKYCYWERLNDITGVVDGFSSADDKVIAGGNEWSGSHMIIEILATDLAFNSYDCGEFTQFVAPEAPKTSFGPGTWLVGSQIVPGRYVFTGDPSSTGCYWRRLSAVTGWSYDVISYAPAGGGTFADIDPTDFAFSSNGCGNWTLMP